MTIKPLMPYIASWRSTVVGVISGLIGLIEIYLQVVKGVPFAAAVKDPTIWLLFLVAVHGLVTKDAGVTGGTRGTPSTPQALADANQAPAVGLAAPKQP